MCDVSETAPVMSRGPRRDEMEGTGDDPPPPTKQEEGEAELPQEQREGQFHFKLKHLYSRPRSDIYFIK